MNSFEKVGILFLTSNDSYAVVVCIIVFFLIIKIFLNITPIDILKTITSLFKEKNKEKQINENSLDNKVIITNINEITQKEEETVKNIKPNVPPTSFENKTNEEYIFPPIDLLIGSKNKKIITTEIITSNNKILEKVFSDFGIIGKVVEVHVGPTVTQYEVEIKKGIKVDKILSINREIALALAAKDVRIQAPIPGKSTIGIEIPNPVIKEVKLKDILKKIPKKFDNSKLVAPLGLDIMGKIQYFEINKAPHMLVAGSTGSGKSVCINNIITSIIMRARPDEVKMILVDPKKVELSFYEDIPHLLMPVVTDPKKAAVVLQKACIEMEKRYDMFAATGTKNISSYNEYVEKHKNKDLEKLPYILIVIDELTDLMMVASKEVEESIMRITQLARAAGIHLIITTSRIASDILTNNIKSNMSVRICFMVSSQDESKLVLEEGGAEKLLGKGDMLFLAPDTASPVRIQSSFVTDEEITRVVDFIKVQRTKTKYEENMLNLDKSPKDEAKELEIEAANNEEDPLYNEIVEFAVRTGKISASLIQRKYRLGYNRAARIIDLLEERGIIGPQNGSKPRKVLVRLEGQSEGSEE